MARVVVVGGGMAGLATAVRLRAAKHDVVVLERSDTVGGKAARTALDGFAWDLGPTLVTLPAVYRDLFATTGPALEECLELVPVDPVCRYTFADGTRLDMPNASRARIGAALDDALGAGSGQQWLDLLTRGGEIWHATRDSFLTAPLRGLRAVPSLARGRGPCARSRRTGRCARSASSTCASRTCAPCSTGTPPTPAPTRGAHRPPWPPCRSWSRRSARGPWWAACTGSRSRPPGARGCWGAEVRTSAEVEEVLVEGGRVRGVRLADGEEVPADVVVSAVDAHVLYRDLLPAAGRPRARRAAPAAAVVVRLPAAARAARAHTGSRAAQRAVRARLRRRVRRALRHRDAPRPPAAGGRPDPVPAPRGRGARRRARGGQRAGERALRTCRTARAAGSTGTQRIWP